VLAITVGIAVAEVCGALMSGALLEPASHAGHEPSVCL
jgi:hypothetical protein